MAAHLHSSIALPFGLALIVLVFFCLFQKSFQSLDMTQLHRIIENETCKVQLDWLHYRSIGSLWMYRERLHLFYTENDSKPFELSFYEKQSLSTNNNDDHQYRTIPIYHLPLERNSSLRKIFETKEHQQLMDNYLKLMKLLYYYPIDWDIRLMIFQEGNPLNDKANLAVIYNIHGSDDNGGGGVNPVISRGNIAKGTVPLLHWKENYPNYPKQNIKIQTTFINNIDYTYQSGYLIVDPWYVHYEQTLYYGFNKKMDKIYFSDNLQTIIANVPDYFAASSVLSTFNWHPFQCYDYIYLYADRWILIMPYLNITKQIEELEYPAIMMASITLMHRNTFFRCTRTPSLVLKPNYPSLQYSVFMKRHNWKRTIILSVVFLSFIATAIFVLLYYRKRLKQQQEQQELLKTSKNRHEILDNSPSSTKSTGKFSQSKKEFTESSSSFNGGGGGRGGRRTPLLMMVSTTSQQSTNPIGESSNETKSSKNSSKASESKKTPDKCKKTLVQDQSKLIKFSKNSPNVKISVNVGNKIKKTVPKQQCKVSENFKKNDPKDLKETLLLKTKISLKEKINNKLNKLN